MDNRRWTFGERDGFWLLAEETDGTCEALGTLIRREVCEQIAREHNVLRDLTAVTAADPHNPLLREIQRLQRENASLRRRGRQHLVTVIQLHAAKALLQDAHTESADLRAQLTARVTPEVSPRFHPSNSRIPEPGDTVQHRDTAEVGTVLRGPDTSRFGDELACLVRDGAEFETHWYLRNLEPAPPNPPSVPSDGLPQGSG